MTPKALTGSALALATLALALGTFMQVLDTSIANVSIPAIAGDLAASPNQGTWIITSFAVSNAIMLPITGWLARRVGEVRLFATAAALFTVASWACGLATSLPMLIFFRVVQGAVAGPMIPLSQSLLLANYPDDKKGMALALWSMTVIVAPILGPILGGWITDNISWPWIFYINIPVGFFSAFLTWQLLKHRESPITRQPIDIVGLVLLIVGIGSLQILLDKGNELDWFSSSFIAMLAAVSAVTLSFFIAWELKGKYPAILDDPTARELFDDANTLLDEIIADGLLTARGGYGFWPAHSEADDIVVEPAEGTAWTLPMLRQQTAKPDGRPNRCLADYVAPSGDHVGAFAVAIHGADVLSKQYEVAGDDYKSIMVKALADRLAEAFAEHTHLRARRDWYEPDGEIAIEELHAERFRGIRPAFGYPASPDHSLKHELFALLGAGDFGMALTESFAMTPASSVSGMLFANPASRYFTVGRLSRDQVADYARRRDMELQEAERWLRPNLAYDPQ